MKKSKHACKSISVSVCLSKHPFLSMSWPQQIRFSDNVVGCNDKYVCRYLGTAIWAAIFFFSFYSYHVMLKRKCMMGRMRYYTLAMPFCSVTLSLLNCLVLINWAHKGWREEYTVTNWLICYHCDQLTSIYHVIELGYGVKASTGQRSNVTLKSKLWELIAKNEGLL